MKSLLLMVLLTSLISSVRCQLLQDFEIEYQVRFNDAFDRGRKERMHKGFLFIHENRSRFYMIADEKFVSDNENDKSFEPDTNIMVYTDHAANIVVAREYTFDGKPFYLTDSLYPMQWDISGETRQIDSLICIKATCQFRGRRYEAWFCPDIPVPFGPWKMGGLPGLIIDLRDENENMLVRLSSIRVKEQKVDIPTGITTSMSEHIQKMKELRRKLQENARTSGSGDCISCQTQSKYEFFTWEKIPG